MRCSSWPSCDRPGQSTPSPACQISLHRGTGAPPWLRAAVSMANSWARLAMPFCWRRSASMKAPICFAMATRRGVRPWRPSTAPAAGCPNAHATPPGSRRIATFGSWRSRALPRCGPAPGSPSRVWWSRLALGPPASPRLSLPSRPGYRRNRRRHRFSTWHAIAARAWCSATRPHAHRCSSRRRS